MCDVLYSQTDIIAQQEFRQLLTEAKNVVPEPGNSEQEPSSAIRESSGPRLVLKPPKTPEAPQSQQKLKLKFATRQSTEKQENGFSVDSESLRKQQELVRAGSSGMEPPGQTPSRNLRSRSGSGLRPRTTSTVGQASHDREVSQNAPAPSPAQQTIKPETATQTPDLAAITPQSLTYEPHGSAPPPAIPEHLVPLGAPRALRPWEIYNTHTGRIERGMSSRTLLTIRLSSMCYLTLWSDLRHALIHNVTLSTSPGQTQMKVNVPAVPGLEAQSHTLALGSGIDSLSFVLTVANNTLDRQTLLSIDVDGNKQVITSAPTPVSGNDRGLQRFDVPVGHKATGRSLQNILIEMIAAEGRGLQHLSVLDENKVQREKFLFFVHSTGI